MKIEHSYNGTRDEAYAQIDSLISSLQSEHGDKISNPLTSWNDAKDLMNFSFKVYGFKLKGTIQIYDKKVILDGKVPFLARGFQGKAEDLIKGKLEEIL